MKMSDSNSDENVDVDCDVLIEATEIKSKNKGLKRLQHEKLYQRNSTKIKKDHCKAYGPWPESPITKVK